MSARSMLLATGIVTIQLLVLLYGCSLPPGSGIRVPDPQLFSISLTLLREEMAKERIPFAVIPRPITGGTSDFSHLDANLVPANELATRKMKELLDGHSVPMATSLGWKGCPGVLSPDTPRSACPAKPMAVAAIGSPEPLDSMAAAAVPDCGVHRSSCTMIRTITTFRAPDGAHTRFMNLVFRHREGNWELVRRVFVSYLE